MLSEMKAKIRESYRGKKIGERPEKDLEDIILEVGKDFGIFEKMEKGGKVGPTPRPKPGDLNESMGRMIDPQPVRRATVTVNQKGPKSRPKRKQDKKTLSGQFLNLIKGMIDDASDTSPITMKKGGAAFPDLTGDGKVTKKDILRGRGVPGFKRGGAASNVCRGGGAALRGTRFTGVK